MQVQDMLCNPSSPNKSLNELSSSNCSVSVSPSQHHHQHQHHSASHQHHHQQLNHHISNQHIHAHTQHSPITDDQPLSLPDAHARTHTPAHPDQQWSGRASSPHGSLSNSARQSPPCFPRRRQLSAASLTPAHTPILTPANPSASFTATTSSSTSSSQNSDTPSTSAYSSGSSSRNHSHSPPAVMSSMPQVGHAPVSAALQAQALEAMYERPSSSSPPPGSGGAATAAGNGMNNGNGISSRRAGASHRRKSQHGPMRAPIRPYTPSGPTPPRRGGAPPQPTGAAAAPGAYNQPTRAFILERLHEYAPLALSNPRTADVRIVVPSRPPQAQSSRRASEPLTSGSMSASSDARDSTPVTPNGSANGNSNGNGTGGVQAPAAAQAAAQAQAQQSQAEAAQQGPPGSAPPATPHIPVRFYALHRDYLVPQSALFRTILTGGFKDGSPEVKGCKLLPYTSLHGPRPVFVPLPDPESFDALVHWMYFGDVAKLEAQLSSGEVKWRGLIRNIQYLGCDERTRTVVAKWWQRWAQAERNGARANREKDDSEDEADEVDAGRGARRVPLSGGRKQGPGGGPPVDDEDDDDERESSSYDNVDDKLSSPWPSTDNLNYSVDADEMTRKLGGL